MRDRRSCGDADDCDAGKQQQSRSNGDNPRRFVAVPLSDDESGAGDHENQKEENESELLHLTAEYATFSERPTAFKGLF